MQCQRGACVLLRLQLPLVASLAAGACLAPADRVESRASRGPRITAVDTLILSESAGVHLSAPITLYRNRDGGFYVADLFQGHAVYYDARGHPVQIYGKPGGGPGEIRQATQVFLRDDSTVVIFDVSRGLLNMYNREDGLFRGAVSVQGGSHHAVRGNGAVWLELINRKRGTALAKWKDNDSSLEYYILLPKEYLQSGPLGGIFGVASLVVWQDTVAVGMAASDTIRVFTDRGGYASSFVVPARKRKGVPSNLLDLMDIHSGLSFEEMFSAASALMQMYRKRDGSLVLVHADQQIHGRLITADVYVSLISPDRRRACVDAPLEVSKDAQPVYAFHADTLYVLEQRVVNDTDVKTTITGYTVDGEGCDWIDLE